MDNWAENLWNSHFQLASNGTASRHTQTKHRLSQARTCAGPMSFHASDPYVSPRSDTETDIAVMISTNRINELPQAAPPPFPR